MNKKEKMKRALCRFGFSALFCAGLIALTVIHSYTINDGRAFDFYMSSTSSFLFMIRDKPLAFISAFVFAAAFWAVCGAVIRKRELPIRVFTYSVLLSAPIVFAVTILTENIICSWIMITAAVVPFALTRFISVKKESFKRFSYASGAVISAALLTATFFVASNSINLGQPDKTFSSWGAINQDIDRAEGWQKIVKASDFKLGDERKEDGATVRDIGSYPAIDGSTVCVPMAMEFARQHLDLSDSDSKYFTYFSTTHYAYEKMITGKREAEYEDYISLEHYNDYIAVPEYYCDILLGTEPSNEELQMAKDNGVELIKEPICYDAFVFITHKDNPVESLSVEQIKDIYSGKITNWKQVGGKNEKIRAFQREPNSGSQTAMENLVMGGRDMIDPIEILVIEGMGQLVDRVAEYQNETRSLGYTYRYYIDTLYKNDNIKTVAVNGIEPTDENIRSGKYPFSTNYYGVIRKGEESSVGGKFLEWILSDEGQACVRQAGYISVR